MKENDIAGILTSSQTIALVGRATNRIARVIG
jgi:predicted CoA-binding protein